MLKFGTFRGTLLSGPYNKDPTIEGTRARMSLHKLQRSSARASELQPSSHRQLGLAVFGGVHGRFVRMVRMYRAIEPFCYGTIHSKHTSPCKPCKM